MGRPAGRVQLACKRSRKVRCGGEWPRCRDCLKRGLSCEYTSTHPSAPKEALEKLVSSLPAQEHVRQVVEIFFDYYGSTFFTFLVRHRFMEDLANGRVPLRLLFSILALASRFHEPFYTLYKGTLEASEHFCELARNELRSGAFNEVNIINLQCYLILAQVEMGCGQEHRAWILLGIAHRMVQILRLTSEDKFERKDLADAEIKRRTFWCCFILDKLISNGSDRPPSLDSKSITTLLPVSDHDFLLGRETQTTTLAESQREGSLLSYVIRIVDILGSVVAWSGGGGRDIDKTPPWDPDMPFSRFEKALDDWETFLPRHMKLHSSSLSAHVACGQGNLFALMHLLNYHARCYLHREYLSFIPPPHYDPANGPCDGPQLARRPSLQEPPDFWLHSVQTAIQSARRTSTFFEEMVKQDLGPWVYPFSGMCLMTASTLHVFCSLSSWKSCEEYMGIPAKRMLAENLRHMIKFQEIWNLAAHWIQVLRRYYERVAIENSGTNKQYNNSQPTFSDELIVAESIMQLREGVMHSIWSVTDAPEGVDVRLPSKEYDIYALLELEPGDDDTEDQPNQSVSVEENQLGIEEDFGTVEIENGFELTSEDITSFDAFLASWK